MKACLDHKFGLTTGGHNIMIDVIENDIVTACLTLGSNLLRTRPRNTTRRGKFGHAVHIPSAAPLSGLERGAFGGNE